MSCAIRKISGGDQMDTFIEIKGARENNLKNVSLRIPKNKLVVFTGLSGSGKHLSLFVTVYNPRLSSRKDKKLPP